MPEPWIKLQRNITRHQRAAEAGSSAMWLYIGGLTYCDEFETDGRIPARALGGLTTTHRQPEKDAAQLVQVGLWSKDGDTYVVERYLEKNRSAAEIRAQRERASRAGKRSASQRTAERSVNDPLNTPSTETPTEVEVEREEAKEKPKSFVDPEKSGVHHRPQDWGTHQPILKLLESLDASVSFSLNGSKGLFHPEFWQRISALTSETKVFYDDELRKYVAWLAEQPPSNRHRNLQVGFSRWIRKEIAKESWQAKRKELT